MSRSTSKKTGKSNTKGAQNKAATQPVTKQDQKADSDQAAIKSQDSKPQKSPNTSKPKNSDSNNKATASQQAENKNETKQKVQANDKPLSNKPLINKESSTSKESSASKESSVDKKPLTDEKPLADKKAVATKEPSPMEEDSNNKKPSTNKNSRSTGTETVQTTTNKQSSGKQSSGLSIFAILLSLIALGLCGYQWYSSQINSTNNNTQFALDIGQIGSQVTRISDSVVRLKEDQADIVTQAELDNKIIKANAGFDKQFRDLEQSQRSIVTSVATINEELRKGANQYVLDEVSQLLRLGNNSAIFTNNAESAINAFTLADIQLKELNNPRYAVVRRKINEEIQLLKSIEQVDPEKILAQLHSISGRITSFPLENDIPNNSITEDLTATNDEAPSTWHSELRKMFFDIFNSISIQKVDQLPKELLAPKEHYLLNQNIQLQLAKAEIALLQNNQSLYKNSISEASKWISDYFDPESDVVKNTLAQLKSLNSEDLNVKLPAVSGSYDLLQTIKGGQ